MTNKSPKNSERDNWIKNRIRFIFITFVITVIALLTVSLVSFGTLFELFSNPVLGLFGLKIGLTPSILGIGTLWGIASGGLAFIIAELLRDLLSIMYEKMPPQFAESVSIRQRRILKNIFIAVIVVPFTIVILTAVVAAQFNTVEVLWDVLMVGYSGAIIGAYSEIISNVVPKSN